MEDSFGWKTRANYDRQRPRRGRLAATTAHSIATDTFTYVQSVIAAADIVWAALGTSFGTAAAAAAAPPQWFPFTGMAPGA